MKTRIYSVIIVVVLTAFTAHLAWAGLGSYPGFKQTISQSSLICAGQVRDIHLEPSTQKGSPSVLVGTFEIDHVVKGTLSSHELQIPLEEVAADKLPEDASSQVRGKRWLLFLQSDGAPHPAYSLVGGLHGMILGASHVPSSIPKDDDPEAHLESELLAALTSDNPQVVGQSMALIEEWARKGTNMIAALRALSTQANETIRGQAIATRISLDDLSALPLALSYRGPEHTMNQIRASIASVSDPRAIPELIGMAEADEVYIRRGAIYSLRMFADKGRSSQLTPVFRAALDDADRDVQYNAGMGLGRLSGASPRGMVHPSAQRQHDASPSLPARDEFDKDPDKYVDCWKKLSTGMKQSPAPQK